MVSEFWVLRDYKKKRIVRQLKKRRITDMHESFTHINISIQ